MGEEIREHKPDLVYTTCSPFSINLIGAWCKSKYQIPWITDFRDLWTLNPDRKRFLISYHRTVSNLLEKTYLKYCDALVVNTDASKLRMIEKYPFLDGKTFIIPNGFDSEDIPSPIRPSCEGTFFYSGLIDLANDYTPFPILKLLAKMQETGALNNSCTFHYAGNEGTVFGNLCKQAGLSGRERMHGYLDHTSFYGLIQTMSYVLLCMPSDANTSSWVPARVYDYIGNKSRIICLASRISEVAKIIAQYGNGLTLFYEETEDVQMRRLHEFLLKGAGAASDEFIKCFSRRSLTIRLAELFNRVSAVNGRK